jgi:hypothetical protein
MFQTVFQVEQQKHNDMNELKELSRFMAVEITTVVYGPYYGPREDWPQKETTGEIFANPKNKRDFPVIFERNYREHLKAEPDTTPQDYQQYAKDYLLYLMRKIESRYKAPNKIGNYRWAERFYNEYLINGLGFDSVLSHDQLKKIYPKMNEYCATSKKHFIAALTPRPLPPGFEPVKWIHLNKKGKYAGNPNQYSFRAFLEVVTGGKTIRKKQISPEEGKPCFTQPDGQPMKLMKRQANDLYYQRYIKRFSSWV